MVSSDEIAGVAARLHGSQPGVAGATREGLGGPRTEAEFTQFEREAVSLGEPLDRLSDRPTVRPNPVVGMSDDQRQPEGGPGLVEQIQQRDRIGSSRDGDECRPRRWEQPGGLAVGTEAVGQRSGHI